MMFVQIIYTLVEKNNRYLRILIKFVSIYKYGFVVSRKVKSEGKYILREE